MCHGPQTELNLTYQRAPDCSLDSRRAHGLGFNPTAVALAMTQVVKRYMNKQWM